MSLLDKIKFFKKLMDDPELNQLYQRLKERKLNPEIMELEDALIRWAGFLHHHSLEYAIQKGMKVGKNPKVEPLVIFMGFEWIEIGDDFVASSFSTIRAVSRPIKIGNQVSLGPGVAIIGANHGIEPNSPHQLQPQISAEIEIGDDVWIGAGAIVLPGVKIGSGAIIGAQSLVSKDLPENTICAGIPAQVVKKR